MPLLVVTLNHRIAATNQQNQTRKQEQEIESVRRECETLRHQARQCAEEVVRIASSCPPPSAAAAIEGAGAGAVAQQEQAAAQRARAMNMAALRRARAELEARKKALRVRQEYLGGSEERAREDKKEHERLERSRGGGGLLSAIGSITGSVGGSLRSIFG